MDILFTTDGGDQLSVNSKIASMPSGIELISNHPNPFNPVTTIKFAINNYSNVDLIITDISGREVARLLDKQFFSPGTYSYDFNASSLSTGIYFYTLKSDLEVVTNKMLFLK